MIPLLLAFLLGQAPAAKPAKPKHVPMIIVNPGEKTPHWGCPVGYTLREHVFETLPTGKPYETVRTAQSDYTLTPESKKHFNFCADQAISDWDLTLKEMRKE